MSPEDYCIWCRDTHAGLSCAEHEEQERQYRINNPHSCWQCRRWPNAA